MLTQVLQVGARGQVLLDQLARRRREQDLSSISSAHDASSVMHVHPNVAVCSPRRFARMQPNAHAHRGAIRPRVTCEGSLYIYSCRDGIGGTGKGDKEGVSLGIDLVTIVLLEQAAQQVSAIGQHFSIVLT